MTFTLPAISAINATEQAAFVKSTLADLSKIAAAENSRFSQSGFMQSADLKEMKAPTLTLLAGISTVCSYLEALESNIRKEFATLFTATERLQVIKHEMGDIWGQVLTLRKTLQQLELSLSKKGSSEVFIRQVTAEIVALRRAAVDALNVSSKFLATKLNSPNLATLHAGIFSLVKSDISAKLEQVAVAYINDCST